MSHEYVSWRTLGAMFDWFRQMNIEPPKTFDEAVRFILERRLDIRVVKEHP